MFEEFPDATISVKEATSSAAYYALKNFLLKDKRWLSQPPSKNPKPGQGPPRWMMESGSFEVEVSAVRHLQGMDKAGMRTQVKISATRDPMVMGGAWLTTELVLTLLQNGPVSGKAGFLTPAHSVDLEVLEQRLQQVDNGKFVKIERGTGLNSISSIASTLEGPLSAIVPDPPFLNNCPELASAGSVFDVIPCILSSPQ